MSKSRQKPSHSVDFLHRKRRDGSGAMKEDCRNEENPSKAASGNPVRSSSSRHRQGVIPCHVNSDEMEQSKWQTISKTNQLCSTHWKRLTIFHVVNNASDCKLGLVQDADFAGDLTDLESARGGAIVVIIGRHTHVPISWSCKTQTAVSHSSTEGEIISSDARLRIDGIPVLSLWDKVIDALEPFVRGDPQRCLPPSNPKTRVGHNG